MHNLFIDLLNVFCGYEMTFSLKEKKDYLQAVDKEKVDKDSQNEGREDELDRYRQYNTVIDMESSNLSEELLLLSLSEYMEEFTRNNPAVEGQIVHAVISTGNSLALFCTEEGSRYCHRHEEEISKEASLKLRVSSVYIVELDSSEALTEQEVQEVMNRIDSKEREKNKREGVANKSSVREVKIENSREKRSNKGDEEEKEGYSLEELHDLASNRGLDKTPLKLSLCRDILDYLWNREKDDLLQL